MHPVVVGLAVAAVLAVCVHGAAVMVSMSTFVDEVIVPNAQDGFTCSFDVFEGGKNESQSHTWLISGVMQVLKNYHAKVLDGELVRPKRKPILTIAIQRHQLIAAQLTYTATHNTTRFIVFDVKRDLDLLCIELLAIHRQISVLLPIPVESQQVLTARHKTEYLERYLSVAIPVPNHDVADVFQNKASFAQFLRAKGFGNFLPATYKDASSVIYPAFIKENDLGFGNGITIVNNIDELIAVKKNITSGYTIQEAISCPTEPAVMFVSRHGQLLGAVCTVDKQSKSLFVAGMKDAPNPQFVHCGHLERVFPIMDLLHRIVRTAGFNGNGCVNYKYTPQTMTQEALDAYMHDIPTVLPGEAVPLYTWFGDRRLLVEGAQYEAAARVFEVNPRVCGPVKDQDVLIDMIRLYMDDFYL